MVITVTFMLKLELSKNCFAKNSLNIGVLLWLKTVRSKFLENHPTWRRWFKGTNRTVKLKEIKNGSKINASRSKPGR